MISQLRTALYTTGKTVTGLNATNYYFEMAKQGNDYPYCVFYEIASPRDFDSGSKFEICVVQFSIYGKTLSSLETLSNNFKSVFDFGKDNLSVSGYDVITCIQQNEIGPSKFEKTWQIALEYRVELQKSR